jgi:hypothetical protein
MLERGHGTPNLVDVQSRRRAIMRRLWHMPIAKEH